MAKKTTKVRTKRTPSEVSALHHRIAELEAQVAQLQQVDQGRRALFDFHLDAVFSLDQTGQFLAVNPAVEKLSGYTQAELLEMNFEQVCAPDQRARARENFTDELRGISRDLETAIITKDGQRRELFITGGPVEVSGQIVGVFGIARDITDRKLVEEQLRESEQKYRKLHESMWDAFVSVDMQGRVQDTNRAYQEMLGYSAAELQQLTYIDLTPAKWHTLEARIVAEQVLPLGHSAVYEKEYRRKDGLTFPVELRTFLIRDAAGQPSLMWAIVRDISARKRTEEALRVSAALAQTQLTEIESIYNSALVGLCVLDCDLRYVHINEQLAQMNGRSLADHIGRTLREVLPSLTAATEALLQEIIAKGEPVLNAEITSETPAQPGVLRTWLTSLLPLKNANGKVTGLSVVTYEITDRKRVENTLRESEARLALLVQTAPVGITIHAADGRLLRSNPTGQELLGLTEEEARGKTLNDRAWQFLREDGTTLPQAEFPVAQVLAGCERFANQIRGIQRANRQDVVWVLVNAVPLRDKAGQILEVIVSFMDLTPRIRAEQSLRASEAGLQLALDASNAGTWSWDVVNNSSTWDDRFHNLYGFAPDEPISFAAWMGRIHPEDREPLQVRIQEFLKHGANTVWSEEFRVMHPVKGEQWMATVGRVERDATGRAVRFSGINLDVTERKRAEEALRHSEARFRHLAEAMPQGVWIRKADGESEFINQWFLDYMGLSETLTLQAALLRVVHPDDLPAVRLAWQQAVATETTYRTELRMRSASGDYHWFLSRAVPIRDAAGRVIKWFGTSTNIDEQKAAEAVLRRSGEELERIVQERTAALRESEERFRQLATNIREVFYLEGAEPIENLYVSPAYEEIWGRTCASLRAAPKSWAESIHPEDLDRALRMISGQGRRDGYDIEYRILRPDGELRWIRDRGFPIHDAAGQVYRVAGICEDITEHKRLEREILDISEREQRRIGYDLHDGLCQVLTGTAYTTAVLRHKLQQQSLPEAAEAEQIEKHLMGAIGQARGLARGLSPVDLGAEGLQIALEQLAASVTSLFHVPCTFTCPQPVPLDDPVVALHLYRIAQEAVNNAIRHGKPQQIRIALAIRQTVMTLTVEDDGTGLPTGYNRTPGMGLRIMAHRASMIGGSVTVQRGQAGGTVVECSCPAMAAKNG